MYKNFSSICLIAALLTVSNFSNAQYVFEPLHLQNGGGMNEHNITVIDTFIYSVTGNQTTELEPWIIDGTIAGSKMIKDINPGAASSIHFTNDQKFISSGGKVYFGADDGTHGYELWVTDGTTNGTHLVRDIYPGAWPSAPKNPADANGKLYFSADDGTNGRELWVTDGTANGTQMVKDINPGSGSSSPEKFIAYQNKVYFVNGIELWVTDGTTNGTQIVKNFSSYIDKLILFNNKLYIFSNGIWESNGTANGTQSVSNIDLRGDEVVVFSGKMYFSGRDTITIGNELYTSDGTTNGTYIIKDIYTQTRRSSDPEQLTVVGNQLFFEADDGIHGEELWVTDGTTAGTKLVKDIAPGPSMGSRSECYTAYGNKLFFQATDSIGVGKGDRLWESDGTTNGTKKIINPQNGDTYYVEQDRVPFAVCNNSLYYLRKIVYTLEDDRHNTKQSTYKYIHYRVNRKRNHYCA